LSPLHWLRILDGFPKHLDQADLYNMKSGIELEKGWRVEIHYRLNKSYDITVKVYVVIFYMGKENLPILYLL
jgi:hypothetical protein